MYYEIYRDAEGEHRWRMKTDNGRIVGDSGQGYKTHSGALKASRRVWSLNQSFFYKVRES